MAPLSVETVTRFARATLLLAVVGCGYRLLPSDGVGLHGAAWNGWSHLALGYGLTVLAFAAFPRARRGDLLKIVLLIGAVAEVARRLAGCACGPWDFVADVLGAAAVAAPSYLEQFRTAVRRPASDRFTLSVANDRRSLAPERYAPQRFAAAGAEAPRPPWASQPKR